MLKTTVLLLAAGTASWALLRGLDDAPKEAPAAPKEAPAATKPADAGEKTAAADAEKAPAQDPANGWLEGTITLDGPAPEVKAPMVDPSHQDHAVCSAHVKQEKLIVSEKKELKDVVVSVSKFKAAAKVKPRVCVIENKNCAFVPHVQATTVGSIVKLVNSDKVLHNTHGLLSLGFFNNAIGGGQTLLMEGKPIRKAGQGVVSCDLHTWMQSHVWVFDHDLFDVTPENGTYKIANIPPGEYEIDVWHEYPLAQQKQKVKIEAGKATKLDVGLKAVQK